MTKHDMERLADEAAVGTLSRWHMETLATEAIYQAWSNVDREAHLTFSLQMLQGIKNLKEQAA